MIIESIYKNVAHYLQYKRRIEKADNICLFYPFLYNLNCNTN